jgi:TolA-binding protein
MRTWMRLIPAVLLAIPFTGSARAADETTDQKIKKLQDDVAQLRKDLESLSDEVKKSNARGARVAEDLQEIRTILQHPQPAGAARLADDIQEIKTILRDMASKQAAITRQAAYGPSGVPAGAPLPATGTITVQNNYSAAASVLINGRPYRVAAGQTVRVTDVPTGTFQYSVDVDGYGTVGPVRTDTLQPVGYRITVFPGMP